MQTSTMVKVAIGLGASALLVVGLIVFKSCSETENGQEHSTLTIVSSSSSSALSVPVNPHSIAQSIDGLDNADTLTTADRAAIGVALSEYLGNGWDAETSELSVVQYSPISDAAAGTPDAYLVVHDDTTQLDYMLVHLNDEWVVQRSSELSRESQPEPQASSAPQSQTSAADTSSSKAANEKSEEELNAQNQWSSLFNFNNAIFNIDDALTLQMAQDQSLISNTMNDTISTGVRQFLADEGLSHAENTTIFIEKSSIKEDGDIIKLKALVNHVNGSIVLDLNYDKAQDGVYVDLAKQGADNE